MTAGFKENKWLYDVLSNTLTITSWKGFKKLPLSDAAGFTSDLYRVEPIWEGKDLPKTLIVKALNFKELDALNDYDYDKSQNKELMEIFHYVECQIYNLFTKTAAPLLIPRIYFCSDGSDKKYPAVIVMEDLGKYHTMNMIDGLNEQQLYAVVDELVKLHYYSLTTNEWRSLLPTELPNEDMFLDVIKFLLKKLQSISPGRFDKVDKIFEIFTKADPFKYYKQTCKEELNSVIVHGDLWIANLLWDGNELKSIIDWQQAHSGNIVEDLIRILVTGLKVPIQQKVARNLLKYYYQKLTEIFQKNGRKLPFSFQYVQDSYKRMLPVMTGLLTFSVAVWAQNNQPAANPDSERQRVDEMLDRLEALVNEAYITVQNEPNTKNFYGKLLLS